MYKFIVIILLSFLNPANANGLRIDFSGAKLTHHYDGGEFEKLQDLITQKVKTSCPGESLDLIARSDDFVPSDLFAASQYISLLNRSDEVLFEVAVGWYNSQLNGNLHGPRLYKFTAYSCYRPANVCKE